MCCITRRAGRPPAPQRYSSPLAQAEVTVVLQDRCLSNLFPVRCSCRACAGNLAGLALSPLLLVKYGWRSIFLVFGALGLPLLALWHLARQAQPPGQGLATSRQPSEDGTKSVIR